jgi:chromosome partitioning protein
VPKVYALANQKGGVGKTTTSINLAAYLAAAGRRVMLIDFDPQANTTTGLGIEKPRDRTIYEVLVQPGTSINDAAMPASSAIFNRPNLTLVPSTMDLAGAEVELAMMDNPSQRVFKLREAIEPVRHKYDYILMDCGPSLGMLTLNALTAADGVLIPLQCEFLPLEGLKQLINTIDLVKKNFNPTIELTGVILTMFDPRTKLATEVVREVRAHFPNETFQTIIGRNVRLSEAPSRGSTILEYDANSPGALAYRALAEEVISRG